jgi:hypothetical protein
MATAARAIGDEAWAHSASRTAGAHAPDPPPGRPTYGELALTGVALVAGLAERGDWDAAAEHARRLAVYFGDDERRIDAVSAEAFAGLAGATRMRDPEGVRDFGELIVEVFTA